jgi:TonB family protein
MMENDSVVTAFIQATGVLLHQFPVLQQMADIALKSFFLLGVFVVVDVIVRRKVGSPSRHLLWLNALLCLALLPVFANAPGFWGVFWSGDTADNNLSALIELPVYASALAAGNAARWDIVLLVIYLIPVVLLLSRVVFSLRYLRKILGQSQLVTDTTLTMQLQVLRRQLNISRKVGLRFSNHIESPLSFGLFKPQIVLPEQASGWGRSIMTDVLLHELFHVKRLDWLTTLSAYMTACIFWFNPLVWLAIGYLREESENSCDTAVLNAGRSDTEYAESLLGVASSCIHARRHNHQPQKPKNRRNNPLLQTMLDQNTLKLRISRVLEENKMNVSEIRKEIKKTAVLGLLLSTGLLAGLGANQVLLAQEQAGPLSLRIVDAEMVPLNSVEPVYPRSAVEAGIEGWVQVRFTVSADGSVAENSVSIVDAEPADIFNRSAIAATAQFRFSPRITAGQPVEVPNVQYVFRFYLSEESERAAQQ